MKKVKKIFHNFYTVEEKWNYIDKEKLGLYFKILTKTIQKFIHIVDLYMKRYDNGELISKND